MYSVYKITNQINGKQYVGITSRSISERFDEHKSRANSNQRASRLYAAMRKYGVDKFSVVLVDSCENEDQVRLLETKYIKLFSTCENGYNCNLGGHGFLTVPEHIKVKIGDANRGRIISEQGRQNMSAAKKGNSKCAINFGANTEKGEGNPRAKSYTIQFPDGNTEIVTGMRAFCRLHKISAKLFKKGSCRGFKVIGRFNDYRKLSDGERVEYTQASGSACHL